MTDARKFTQAGIVTRMVSKMDEATYRAWQLRKVTDLNSRRIRDAVI